MLLADSCFCDDSSFVFCYVGSFGCLLVCFGVSGLLVPLVFSFAVSRVLAVFVTRAHSE